MKRVLIAVGVNTYQNGIPALSWAVQDAMSIGGFFRHQMGYDRVVTVVLPDEQSASQINERIARVASELGSGDQLTIFFAGHACALKNRGLDEQLLLLPAADPRLFDRFDETLNLKSIVTRTERPGLARWLIIDGCRTPVTSGVRDFTGQPGRADGWSRLGFTQGCERLVGSFRGDSPLWVLNSCSDGEMAMECKELEGGLFTRALMTILSGGGAADAEGRPGADLPRHLVASMRDLAATYDLAVCQRPTFSGTGSLPPLFRRRPGISDGDAGAMRDDVRTWEPGRLQSQAAGLMFELGRRHAKADDWGRARVHFRQAADLGHAAALSMLGQCLMSGNGGGVDRAEAEACFRRALEMRPLPAAWNNLGVLLRQSPDPARQEEAGLCFLAAAQLGHAKGMFNYALQLARRDRNAPLETVIRWLKEAEAGGYAEASQALNQLRLPPERRA